MVGFSNRYVKSVLAVSVCSIYLHRKRKSLNGKKKVVEALLNNHNINIFEVI
jgi:hypothetical protein